MPQTAISCGLALIAVGLGGYFGSGAKSLTALIPAVAGLLLAIPGGISLAVPGCRKHLMHAAATFGLIGFLAAVANVVRVLLTKGGSLDLATACTLAMAAICALFVLLCVRSFRAARKAKEGE